MFSCWHLFSTKICWYYCLFLHENIRVHIRSVLLSNMFPQNMLFFFYGEIRKKYLLSGAMHMYMYQVFWFWFGVLRPVNTVDNVVVRITIFWAETININSNIYMYILPRITVITVNIVNPDQILHNLGKPGINRLKFWNYLIAVKYLKVSFSITKMIEEKDLAFLSQLMNTDKIWISCALYIYIQNMWTGLSAFYQFKRY